MDDGLHDYQRIKPEVRTDLSSGHTLTSNFKDKRHKMIDSNEIMIPKGKDSNKEEIKSTWDVLIKDFPNFHGKFHKFREMICKRRKRLLDVRN